MGNFDSVGNIPTGTIYSQDAINQMYNLIKSQMQILEEKINLVHNGKDGIDGQDGTMGPMGSNGKDGKDGQPGIRGPTGENGQKGEPGKDGQKGIQGLNGQLGKPGYVGPSGKDGACGKDGTNFSEDRIKVITCLEEMQKILTTLQIHKPKTKPWYRRFF